MIEYLRLAFRSIGKRKKRTALTMLGIFVGIAAVVALVSLGQGLQQTLNDQFSSIGADKIFIQAKEVGFGESGLANRLTDRELDLVDDVNGVVASAGYLFGAASVEFNKLQRTVFLMSIPSSASEASLVIRSSLMEASSGRLLSHKDKNKVVIGNNLASNNLFGKNVVVGDKLLINGSVFDVVGVLVRVGDPGLDGSVVMSEIDARRISGNSDAYNIILVQAIGDVDKVGSSIEKAIRRDRHQKEGQEDFSVQTSTELIASFNAVFNIIQVVFVGIAAISLLVGGIGIMNVMFTSVLERTREIGVMKAIGARNNSILMLFLIESGILGLLGGLVGVLIGAGISTSVELGANYAFGAGTIVAVFPAWLVIGALLFSLVIGALSGVLPARRAAKLKPVDALRYE